MDMAMVIPSDDEDVVRDYTNASKVLIAIGLRILEEEGRDEPDGGIRPGVD
jgi:hypothetical protein